MSTKYSKLGKQAQKESTRKFMARYKKKILEVSTWSESDLNAFDESRKLFNQWTIQEWQ